MLTSWRRLPNSNAISPPPESRKRASILKPTEDGSREPSLWILRRSPHEAIGCLRRGGQGCGENVPLGSGRRHPSVIASYANALGWITGGGKPWTARQVLSTLTNHVYAGLVVHGFAFRPGCHAPLVDQDLYHRVQNLISGRRNRIPGQRGSGAGITWVLSGLLCCGECGRLMSSHIVRVGPVLRCYYRCRSTARGRSACKGVMASAHELETAVLSVIGANAKLTSKEQRTAVKEMVRGIVYHAGSGTVQIELIKPLDGSAHAEGEATDRRAGTEKRKSGPRCR